MEPHRRGRRARRRTTGSVDPRSYRRTRASLTELQIIGAYAGPELISTYPNGDQVGYVTTAYRCQLPDVELRLDQDEVLEVGWFRPAEVNDLPRHHWIDRVIADAKVLPP